MKIILILAGLCMVLFGSLDAFAEEDKGEAINLKDMKKEYVALFDCKFYTNEALHENCEEVREEWLALKEKKGFKSKAAASGFAVSCNEMKDTNDVCLDLRSQISAERRPLSCENISEDKEKCKDLVTAYSNGWLGKRYRKIERFDEDTVTSRKKLDDMNLDDKDADEKVKGCMKRAYKYWEEKKEAANTKIVAGSLFAVLGLWSAINNGPSAASDLAMFGGTALASYGFATYPDDVTIVPHRNGRCKKYFVKKRKTRITFAAGRTCYAYPYYSPYYGGVYYYQTNYSCGSQFYLNFQSYSD